LSQSDVVAGRVRDAGKAKILPLSRVSIGFGTAVAEAGGKAERAGQPGSAGAAGGGAGGALIVEPRAFVVVGEDGVPHLLALEKGKSAVVRRGVEILPEPQKIQGSLSEASTPPRLVSPKP
jgi:uncharacterized spore protein YtfJ